MANIGYLWRDDYLKKFAQLTDEEIGYITRRCAEYHAYGTVPALEGTARIVFDVIRDDIDGTNRSYKAKCETNRRNRMSAMAYRAGQSHPANDGSRNTADVPEEQEPECQGSANVAFDGCRDTADVPEEQEPECQGSANDAFDGSRDTADFPDEPTCESGNIVPFSPAARSSRGKRKEPAEGFEAFWAAYPRHISRQNAIRAWNRLSPDAALQETMLEALDRQRASEQWQKDGGQYIPHPATWLNGRRWEDELPARPEGQKTPSRGAMPAAQYSQRDYSEPGESLESALSRLEAAMKTGQSGEPCLYR